MTAALLSLAPKCQGRCPEKSTGTSQVTIQNILYLSTDQSLSPKGGLKIHRNMPKVHRNSPVITRSLGANLLPFLIRKTDIGLWVCLVARATDESLSAQATATAVMGTQAQIHYPHGLGWVWDVSVLLLPDVPASAGLWWGSRERDTCLPESGPVVTHLPASLSLISSAPSPWWCDLSQDEPPLLQQAQLTLSAEGRCSFTYLIINMTHVFFFSPPFLLFIAGNWFDQNQ